jgi:hypothetical protein
LLVLHIRGQQKHEHDINRLPVDRIEFNRLLQLGKDAPMRRAIQAV